MTWSNPNLTLYHGTDYESAVQIMSGGVDLSRCSPLTDFGRGFYTTTNFEQAKNWGLLKAVRIRAHNPKARGAVLRMRVDRNWLGALDSLIFVRPSSEIGYPEFVRFCRSGGNPHRLGGDYKVVYGPVAGSGTCDVHYRRL
jgi:uncharacterized protein DUF3990